jgi:general secretion pathway protein D
MQEASSLASTANVKTTDVVTNKRMINTSILARDGQVIVLGGLMADTVIDTVQKVPLLGDIPILGALFRSHSTTQEKSNLLLFLRPTVVRDDAKVASVTDRKYQTMRTYRSQTDGQEMVLDTRNLLDEDPGKVLETGVTLPSKVSE